MTIVKPAPKCLISVVGARGFGKCSKMSVFRTDEHAHEFTTASITRDTIANPLEDCHTNSHTLCNRRNNRCILKFFASLALDVVAASIHFNGLVSVPVSYMMSAGVCILGSQAVRPPHHVKHMPPSHRQQALLHQARTCCGSTATRASTAVDRNPDHLLHSLETFCNGRVRAATDCSGHNKCMPVELPPHRRITFYICKRAGTYAYRSG